MASASLLKNGTGKDVDDKNKTGKQTDCMTASWKKNITTNIKK